MGLNEIIRDLSALGGFAAYMLALLTFLLLQMFGEFWQLLIGIVLAYAIIAGVRSVYIRDRPKPVQYRTWWQKIDAGTAVSMHAMRATILAIVLINHFRNVWVTTLLIIVALLVAGARVWLKRHYIADAAWGVGVGIIVGFIVLWAI